MKRAVVLLAALLLVGGLQSTAIAGTRYCGTGTNISGLRTTSYVAPAWDRPGFRLMQTRRLWSATPAYYVCRARQR